MLSWIDAELLNKDAEANKSMIDALPQTERDAIHFVAKEALVRAIAGAEQPRVEVRVNGRDLTALLNTAGNPGPSYAFVSSALVDQAFSRWQQDGSHVSQ